jgi:D-alanyl-D-alanine carboxypeptidase (penicillin-binding protein 5/6)
MISPKNDHYYKPAIGIKTGNLEAVGRNIAVAAKSDGTRYLAVLLGAPFNDEENLSRFYHIEDATKLFKWAFGKIRYRTLVQEYEEVAEVYVRFSADKKSYVLLKPVNELAVLWLDSIPVTSVEREIVFYEEKIAENAAVAPVKAGDIMGRLDVKLEGNVLGSVELAATNTLERSQTKFGIETARYFVTTKWFFYAVLVCILLCAIYVSICFSFHGRPKRQPRKYEMERGR